DAWNSTTRVFRGSSSPQSWKTGGALRCARTRSAKSDISSRNEARSGIASAANARATHSARRQRSGGRSVGRRNTQLPNRTEKRGGGTMSKQNGHIVRISGRWYVRYWERRNIGGTVEQKRVSHCLGSITTRGKHPPADIEDAAEQHMATINGGKIPAERITSMGEFVTGVYLPWIERHKRPSTVKCYRDIREDQLKPVCADVWMKNVRTFHV